MKIKDLKPAEYNPRKITEEQLQRLKKSLLEFGDLSGIVFNRRTGNIVGGHQRIKCLPIDAKIEKTDLKEPSPTGTVAEGFVFIEGEKYTYREVDWSLEKEKQANIAANKHGGDWDNEALAALLNELKDLPDFDADLIGFETKEINELISQITGQGLIEDDEIPEVNTPEPITKLGDIYILGGKHRVMCGDSTKMEDVERLMDGKKANSMVTDPPYGVDLNAKNLRLKKYGKGKDWGNLENDNKKGYDIFLKNFVMNARQILPVGANFFMWFSSLDHEKFNEALINAGFEIYRVIIWVKPKFVFSLLPFHWRHEPCLYGWVKGKKGDYSRIPNNETTVWEIDYDGKLGNSNKNNSHPTMKPLSLIQRCVEYASPIGEIVLDLFLGSGTTLIACEKTNRICYGMELDQHYCDVIITRYCQYTGNNKVIKNGEEIEWVITQ